MKISQRIKQNKTKLLYLFILMLTFCIFLILAFLNIQVKKQIAAEGIILDPISFTAEEYPVIKNKALEPFISAQGAVVFDRASQVPLYEKNPDLRFPPASTTKIMTALTALEYFKNGDVLTVKNSTIDGSVLGLNVGEQFYFEDLLYAMLLPSANDATSVIAQNYPGGEEAFVRRMNEKAKELSLVNTYYADPVGLKDDLDYTTSIDLARLASVALENPEFAKAVSTKNKRIRSLGGKSYTLTNLNKLLDLPGVNGVKTGFTEAAGEVLVTSKKVDDMDKDLIIVVMQSLDRFGDTQSLLNYLSDNVSYLSTHP